MQRFSDQRREDRRIILLRLINGEDPEVLLGLEENRRILPQVQVTQGYRVAEQLTSAFKQTCGINALSISSVEDPPTESGPTKTAYEIMEPQRPFEETPNDKHWISVDSLVESGFQDANDYQALRQAVSQSTPRSESASKGPFAHLGWFHRLEQWVQEEIRPHGLHLCGRFRQLNASPAFSLIRFETDGTAVWFKAVGAPNEREYPLTLDLAHSFPEFLPCIIATRTDCNGWLALESEGPLLQECAAFASWKRVAEDLAQLQIRSLDRCVHLLDLGARDLGQSALAALVEPFFHTMGEVMERQPEIPPARLSQEQLCILSVRIQNALSVLEKAGIPATLGHMDFNPGNIVVSPRRSVFLDWAEAFVGHPFLTFEYLLEHLRGSFGQDSSHREQLAACYLSPWRELLSEQDIEDALEVTALVAAFACAVGNDWWTNPKRLAEPRTAGYLRSLTRRMDREAHRLLERSALAQID